MPGLKPIQLNDGNLVLGIPLKWRLVFFGLGFLFVWVMVVNAEFSGFLGLLVMVAVAGGFYTERWLFDLDRQVVVHTEGLLFFSRRKTFSLREIIQVELRNTRPRSRSGRSERGHGAHADMPTTPEQDFEQYPEYGNRGRGFSGLFLVFVDGGEVNVHTTSIKKIRDQLSMGRLIAQVCRKPFSSNA